ncbi:MAG: T9SS type A sorting domain-containing protein [Bacteroidota bacterium]
MKKLLLSTTMFAALLTAGTQAKAQIADGSTAPDWTLTDINGNTYNLYSIIASGKTVFIDFSATWCGPCWSYHNSGALEELWTKHGPTGTCSQDVMVFYIEGDVSTTLQDLQGTGTNTQGNWVAGTPYPIFNPSVSTVMDDYQIAYFPTIYKICTDYKVYEVGQQNEAGLEASVSSCGFSLDAAVSQGIPSLACSTTYTPVFTLKNSGSTTLTAADFDYDVDGGATQTYNWTGSLAPNATTTVTLAAQTVTVAAHTLNLNITSANGGADGNKVNNCYSFDFNVSNATGAAAPLVEAFTTTGFPYTNWILDNPDAAITWTRVTTNGGSLKYDCYNYGSIGQTDDFIIKPVDLSTFTQAEIKFDVAHAQYSTAYTDGLKVYASSDCGATWTQVYSKSGATLATVAATTSAFTPSSTQWRNETASLNAFAGQNKVFIKFSGENGYGNNIYVDNINITNAVGVEEVALENNVTVYPNPVADLATVNMNLVASENVTIDVYNAVGQKVFSVNKGQLSAGNHNVVIDFSSLESGFYFVNVTVGTTTITKKVTSVK